MSTLTSNISIGEVGYLQQNQWVGLVYDGAAHVMVPLSVPDTHIVRVSVGN